MGFPRFLKRRRMSAKLAAVQKLDDSRIYERSKEPTKRRRTIAASSVTLFRLEEIMSIDPYLKTLHVQELSKSKGGEYRIRLSDKRTYVWSLG